MATDSDTLNYISRVYLLRFCKEESPREAKFVRECNGTVVIEYCSSGQFEYQLLAFPYEKFFSCTEVNQSKNQQATKIFEKLDGYQVTLYQVKGLWCIAPCSSQDKFAQYLKENVDFWRIWEEKNYSLPNEDLCYVFEIIGPSVKRYSFYNGILSVRSET